MTVSFQTDEREEWFKQQFHNSKDVVYHPFTIMGNQKCMLIYIQGMLNQQQLHELLLEPLLQNYKDSKSVEDFLIRITVKNEISISNYLSTKNLHKALSTVIDGYALLLIDNEETMVAFPLTEYKMRE